MVTLSNYIDTSTKSLAIAGIVFIVVAVISKYGFDTQHSNEEEKRSTYFTVLYSILIGLICSLLSLALYKQFCESGNCDILTDPFPSKI